jgi:hypothetical protein
MLGFYIFTPGWQCSFALTVVLSRYLGIAGVPTASAVAALGAIPKLRDE